ncbi:hypothetical protein OF846_001403 [Rhodotorula toruloides]|nr:hypothetical protein OF846_001403 [Rhodotorula toruloides]
MATPQPDTRAAQPVQPAEPVLTSKWRRVEAMPAREMLVKLETDEGEGPDDWEEDEVGSSTLVGAFRTLNVSTDVLSVVWQVEYVTLESGNHLPADLLAEHNEASVWLPAARAFSLPSAP